MPVIFKKTVSGILGAWWSFGGGDTEKNRFAQTVLDAGGAFGFPDLVCITCDDYNSQFRQTVLNNAGKWPSWMGVEWADYMPDRAGSPFPASQIQSALLTKTNFIWWLTANRTSEGGYNLDYDVINYLKANPDAGITKEYPGTLAVERTKYSDIIAYPSPAKDKIRFISNSGNEIRDVSLFNLFGNIMGEWRNTSEIDISGFNEGIYILKMIHPDGSVVTQKIFKTL